MWLTSAALRPGVAAWALALPAAPAEVAANVSISMNRRRLNLPCSNSSSFVATKFIMAVSFTLLPRILFFDVGELHRIVERIQHVDVAAARAEGAPGRLQHGVHARIVPIGNRVADVIHVRRCQLAGPGRVRRARDDEGAALSRLGTESEVRPLAVILAGRVRHADERRVPIARLGVIRAGIREMVDADHLESAAWRLRVGLARPVDGGGERHRLAELTAADFPTLEAFHEISDEAFHAGPSLV